MKNPLTRPASIVSIVGQVLVARTAWQRVQEARERGGRVETLDALLNLAALVTGTIVMVRHLRRGEEA